VELRDEQRTFNRSKIYDAREATTVKQCIISLLHWIIDKTGGERPFKIANTY
jgi:hypothetical protein